MTDDCRERQRLKVAELRPPMKFEGLLMVRSLERRMNKFNKEYLDLNLGDKSGEINCKLWNLTATTYVPQAGEAAWFNGDVEEFNGRIQMRINAIKRVENPDLRELIPCAPETPEAMRAQILDAVAAFPTEELRQLVTEMLNMAGEALDWYPAAQRMHHAERAGLLHHTTSMLRTASMICDAYPFLCRELLLAGVIIHDLAKIKEMVSDRLGNVNDYSRDGLLVGHLVRGVSDLDQAATRVGIPPDSEMLALLEHMIISHHGVPEYGSPRLPMFPEAEALHWIDTLDAKMNELQGIQSRIPRGAFSERIHSLDDRRIYHPFFTERAEEKDGTAEAEAPAAPAGQDVRAALEGMVRVEEERLQGLLPF